MKSYHALGVEVKYNLHALLKDACMCQWYEKIELVVPSIDLETLQAKAGLGCESRLIHTYLNKEESNRESQ
jgi:hypothetical protein